MKFRCVVVLIAVVMLVGTSTMMAGGPVTPLIRANVPFAFRVGQQLMPAGQYQVAHYNTRDVLLIRSVDTGKVMLLHSAPSGKYSNESAKLVFNQYGETYFLRQVWIPGCKTNELLQSKIEREYASRWGEAVRTAVVAGANN